MDNGQLKPEKTTRRQPACGPTLEPFYQDEWISVYVGECERCGKAWVRVTETEYANPGNRSTNGQRSKDRKHIEHGTAGYETRLERQTSTLGFEPQCKCTDAGGDACGPVPQTVLDPFGGAGTTMIVAAKLGRRCISIELNEEYAAMSIERYKREMRKPVDPPRREVPPLFAALEKSEVSSQKSA